MTSANIATGTSNENQLLISRIILTSTKDIYHT